MRSKNNTADVTRAYFFQDLEVIEDELRSMKDSSLTLKITHGQSYKTTSYILSTLISTFHLCNLMWVVA